MGCGIRVCVPGRAELLPLRPEPQQEGAPSGPPHLELRKETSLRSRARSFLWDFPKNPHALAAIPLGVSFHQPPSPSLFLGAGVTLAPAGNPITHCGSGSHSYPSFGAAQVSRWVASRPSHDPLIWYEKSAPGRETRPGQGAGAGGEGAVNRKRESQRPAVIWS